MKVKILHCLETIGTGGVEQRRLSLARLLDRDRFEQRVVCSYVIEEFDHKFEKLGVKVFAIRGLLHLFNVGYYFRLFKIVRDYRPHIIHGAVFEGVVSAVVAGILFRVPVIIIEETSDPQNRSWRGNLLMKIFSKLANRTIAISPSVAEYLRKTVHVKEPKLTLINNGVARPSYPAKAEIESLKYGLGIGGNDFVVGSVGRLYDSVKRFSDCIKAVALIGEKVPNLKLMIIGAGPDKNSLENLAHSKGVAKKIIFTGFRKDTASYYATMNIFVLASVTEGFGLVVAEAMFFKLPVIATRVGGLKDIVVHEKTGLLVQKDSPEQIADGIRFLFNNPDIRKTMGDRGFKRAVDEYSAESYVHKVEQLYLQICKQKGIEV